MSGTDTATFDLAIVGGGMAGASLALALAPAGRRIALVEPHLPGSAAQPSFDERTSALANGSKRILETIGAWSGIRPAAAPIERIHVNEAGRLGGVTLTAAEFGLPALGYSVPNRAIGAALWGALRANNAAVPPTLFAPATVREVTPGPEVVRLGIASASGPDRTIDARLVVAADGADSLVRRAAGIAGAPVDFGQVALVVNVRAERASAAEAWERFTPDGALAVLPRFDGAWTVVLIATRESAPGLMAAGDVEWRERLQAAFGWRIGAFTDIGRRSAYPLVLNRAVRSTAQRIALVANSAQVLHPVAAQGFNVGLRDVAELAELAAAAEDPGAPAVLEAFERRRLPDRRGMIGFTDGLVRLFGVDAPGAGAIRSLGLAAFEASPMARRALARISWGIGGHTPRLLRGLPVTGAP